MKYSPIMDRQSVPALAEALARGPEELVAREEAAFRDRMEEVIRLAEDQKEQIILLSGPSSSGKTTASRLLAAGLSRDGSRSCRISLDDFYRPRSEVPTWEDGSKNFESIDGLDLEQLRRCLSQLFATGRARFPIFDFAAGGASPLSRELVFDENTCLIFEGIHALNPLLQECLGGHHALRLYISVHSDFVDGEGRTLLAAQELRLLRRLLRDRVRRNTGAAGTLELWDYVLRGEILYLQPYRGLADVHINSVHGYEPFLYRDEALEMLRSPDIAPRHQQTARRLLGLLEGFPALDPGLVPRSSLLQEFIGAR